MSKQYLRSRSRRFQNLSIFLLTWQRIVLQYFNYGSSEYRNSLPLEELLGRPKLGQQIVLRFIVAFGCLLSLLHLLIRKQTKNLDFVIIFYVLAHCLSACFLFVKLSVQIKFEKLKIFKFFFRVKQDRIGTIVRLFIVETLYYTNPSVVMRRLLTSYDYETHLMAASIHYFGGKMQMPIQCLSDYVSLLLLLI